MTDLILSPLGPAILLAAAGGLLRLLSRPRWSFVLALGAAAAVATALTLLILLPTVGTVSWEAVWWPLIVAPLELLWLLDGWNWLAVLLILLSGLGAVLITWRAVGWRTGAYHGLSLAFLGAACLTVVSDNLLVLSGAWIATDILLVARARGSRPTTGSAPVALASASSLLVFLAIGITSLPIAATSLTRAPLPTESILLLLLAAGLRMAAYPWHLWLTPGSAIRYRGTQWLVAGVALVTGGWLLGRIYPLGASEWLSQPVWPPMLTAAVFAAGLAIWGASPGDRLLLLASSRGAWIWLTLILAGPESGQLALAAALATAVLGLLLFVVGESIQTQFGWRVPLALSAATLIGLPLTVGLVAQAFAPPPNLFLWLLITVGNGLALSIVLATGWPASAVSRAPVAARPPGTAASIFSLETLRRVRASITRPMLRLFTVFGLAAVPVVLWGLRPEALASLVGAEPPLTFLGALGELGFGQVLSILLTPVLAGLFAWLLLQPSAAVPELELWRPRLGLIAGLAWSLHGLSWGLNWLEAAWRTLLRIVEGEAYFGWLLLALLLTWLIVQP